MESAQTVSGKRKAVFMEKEGCLKDVIEIITAQDFCQLKWDSVTFNIEKALIHVHRLSSLDKETFDIKFHNCCDKICSHSLCNHRSCTFNRKKRHAGMDIIEATPTKNYCSVNCRIAEEKNANENNMSEMEKMTTVAFSKPFHSRVSRRKYHSHVQCVSKRKSVKSCLSNNSKSAMMNSLCTRQLSNHFNKGFTGYAEKKIHFASRESYEKNNDCNNKKNFFEKVKNMIKVKDDLKNQHVSANGFEALLQNSRCKNTQNRFRKSSSRGGDSSGELVRLKNGRYIKLKKLKAFPPRQRKSKSIYSITSTETFLPENEKCNNFHGNGDTQRYNDFPKPSISTEEVSNKPSFNMNSQLKGINIQDSCQTDAIYSSNKNNGVNNLLKYWNSIFPGWKSNKTIRVQPLETKKQYQFPNSSHNDKIGCCVRIPSAENYTVSDYATCGPEHLCNSKFCSWLNIFKNISESRVVARKNSTSKHCTCFDPPIKIPQVPINDIYFVDKLIHTTHRRDMQSTFDSTSISRTKVGSEKDDKPSKRGHKLGEKRFLNRRQENIPLCCNTEIFHSSTNVPEIHDKPLIVKPKSITKYYKEEYSADDSETEHFREHTYRNKKNISNSKKIKKNIYSSYNPSILNISMQGALLKRNSKMHGSYESNFQNAGMLHLKHNTKRDKTYGSFDPENSYFCQPKSRNKGSRKIFPENLIYPLTNSRNLVQNQTARNPEKMEQSSLIYLGSRLTKHKGCYTNSALEYKKSSRCDQFSVEDASTASLDSLRQGLQNDALESAISESSFDEYHHIRSSHLQVSSSNEQINNHERSFDNRENLLPALKSGNKIFESENYTTIAYQNPKNRINEVRENDEYQCSNVLNRTPLFSQNVSDEKTISKHVISRSNDLSEDAKSSTINCMLSGRKANGINSSFLEKSTSKKIIEDRKERDIYSEQKFRRWTPSRFSPKNELAKCLRESLQRQENLRSQQTDDGDGIHIRAFIHHDDHFEIESKAKRSISGNAGERNLFNCDDYMRQPSTLFSVLHEGSLKQGETSKNENFPSAKSRCSSDEDEGKNTIYSHLSQGNRQLRITSRKYHHGNRLQNCELCSDSITNITSTAPTKNSHF